MSQSTIWFERKFEFSFPVELHPNLSARLRGTPARLEELLRSRPHRTLIPKPQEKWSAQEHALHDDHHLARIWQLTSTAQLIYIQYFERKLF